MTVAAPRAGTVWLVGAGPGDPDLLTVKAARLIALADAIVYDNLVGPGILAQARAQARLIYVGKKAADHALPQDEINQLLVKLAQEGLAVVRLKGGDPLIFGRGGEELEALATAGIPFEVVPGVTAASGCAAYAGFPLTHREHAQSVVFVTGHGRDGAIDVDWQALARPRQTLVFYMGITRAAEIADALMLHGMAPSTPVAVIRHGTLPDQQTLLTTLEALPSQINAAGIRPPALIIMGPVVLLRQKLAWRG